MREALGKGKQDGDTLVRARVNHADLILVDVVAGDRHLASLVIQIGAGRVN